jgi:hypothetical protein
MAGQALPGPRNESAEPVVDSVQNLFGKSIFFL